MSATSEAYADLGAVVHSHPPAPPAIAAERALLLILVLQRLKRVVTQPGTGDRAFIRDLAPVDPAKFSEAQCAHVMRLAWRYRFSLPDTLRPARNPDQNPQFGA